jgi:membrane-associated phospholipid phosphatase
MTPMNPRHLFFLLLIPAAAPSLRAQEADEAWDPFADSVPDSVALARATIEGSTVDDFRWYSPLTSIPHDWARSVLMIPEPASLQTLAGVGFATAGLIMVDHRTQRMTGDMTRTSPTLRRMAWAAVRFGDGRYHLAFSGALAAYGLAFDDGRALRTGGQIFESMLASGIVVQVLKRTVGRESPVANSGRNGRLRPFPSWNAYSRNQPKYYSFPSGHIATAMSTVTVLAENYPEATWIRPVGYTMVGFLGLSLVNVGYHWYSDLPLGILLGYTFGMLASHPAWEGPEADEHLQLRPMISSKSAGLSVAWVF